MTQLAGTLPESGPSGSAPGRVLMVAVRYFPFMGGVETHVYEVARRLAQKGFEVTVVTTNPEGNLPVEEKREGVQIVRVAAWPRQRDFCVSPQLYRLIASRKWDIVHCQGYHTLFTPLAMLAAWRSGLPYVVSFHSGGHSSRLRNAVRSLQRQVLRPLLAHATKLVAVSNFEAGFFQEKLKLPAQRFVVIPNGAQLPQVGNSEESSGEADSGPLILSVGRLERYKGHQRVISALPKVLGKYPEARLKIVGGGPYEAELQKLVKRLGLGERVTIGAISPNDRQSMAAILNKAAVVALLSDYEAHPVAVMEALALHRPVLVADTSGLRELAERQLVRAIPLNSPPEQVAAALIAQIENPLTPSPVELPTWEDCAANLAALYQQIVVNTSAVSH